MITLEHSILEAVRSLPPDRQREILEHANQLRHSSLNKPRKNGRGLWAGLEVSLPAEQIDQLRGDLWKNFPRGDV
jgi:hypothetical protein